jgi:flagellar protein FlgJ
MIKMPPVAIPEQKDPTSAHAPSAAEKKAAQEFEAIFLRKMLSCMEKSTKVDGASLSSSTDAYSSMIVGALADAVAAAGGIGLGQSILRSVATSKIPPPTHEHSISKAAAQGSDPRTVQELRKGQE